jgi:hypothetical protein
MANKVADNAIFGEMLVWTNLGSDTPVVWSYECPVDTHKVVSPVKLQYNSSDSATGGTAICPLHSATLTGAAAVDVT